ncbi:sulfurtransferase [Belnapia sp. T18]|uniref:Sulfurtransferase n=1 Tax=Belnapia arida TaxID=2804533 RepID=A0ABS1U0C8_9PROT|nr:sulfurtransferase [Belnapia arida]MBL6078136.1 sulfurtransferase [Belnapia arida]
MTATPRYVHPEAIVTTAWLAEHLDDPALRIFDCTTYLRYETGTGRPYRVESGRADYEQGHIPGSAFLDLQGELSDISAPTNFMMPAPEDLAARFAAKGIGEGTRAILYSRKNIQWATRVWWMLRAVGFDNAAVLDGGFDKWSAEARPVEAAEARYPAAKLAAAPRSGLFVGKQEVKAAIGDPGACTINALAPDLHRGDTPRYGRPGRIPGSVNVPVSEVIDSASLTLKTPKSVAAIFTSVGADLSKRIILYCGGGIAATLDAFLLHQLGYQDIAVYDASMSEWAKDETLPIEVG